MPTPSVLICKQGLSSLSNKASNINNVFKKYYSTCSSKKMELPEHISYDQFNKLTYAELFSLIKTKDDSKFTNNPFILAKRY